MVSASHGNDDRLHLNDDRLHGHKGLNPFSNIQSRYQSFLLQTNLRRLSFSKIKRLSFFYISLNNILSFPAGLIYPFISKTEKTASIYQTKILWYFDRKRKSRKQGLLFRIYYIKPLFDLKKFFGWRIPEVGRMRARIYRNRYLYSWRLRSDDWI